MIAKSHGGQITKGHFAACAGIGFGRFRGSGSGLELAAQLFFIHHRIGGGTASVVEMTSTP